ncbi:MAG: transcriptional repressor [Coriobacteriia bacterium]|nr:transcriptional repressor [Coriobacteriia bacterium]
MDRELVTTAYGGGRASAPRLAIARAVLGMQGAFTIDDLARSARVTDSGIGTATIYRAIASMSAAGFIESIGGRDGTAIYIRCAEHGHHHHLVCTSCGAVAHTPCPVDRAVIDHAGAQGYLVTGHEVNLYGLCARCLPHQAVGS